MHARMNMLAGDPAHLGEATRYLEGTVRPMSRRSMVAGALPAWSTKTSASAWSRPTGTTSTL